MNGKYIDRDELVAQHGLTKYDWCDYVDVDKIMAFPAADVKPVIHAHWRIIRTLKLYSREGEWYDTQDQCECSNCGVKWDFYSTEPRFDYCFSCGARMDEGVEN